MEPCVWRVGHHTLNLLASAAGWGDQPNPDFEVGGTSQNLMDHLRDAGVDGI